MDYYTTIFTQNPGVHKVGHDRNFYEGNKIAMFITLLID